MTLVKKISVMALLGAVGAAAGAVLAEALFLGDAPQPPVPRKICLLFDISGSMGETVTRASGEGSITQLDALKQAARDFVERQDFSLDAMGLAVFASGAHLVTGLGHDAQVLQNSIGGLNANGGTNLGRGLDVAARALEGETDERWILLFSDGKPETSSTDESAEAAALSAAARAREAGIRIVAIGTGLADADLLAQATGSVQNVIISDPRALAEAFRRSEAVINRQMLASRPSTASFKRSVAWTALWASVIAMGAGFGLVVGQNRHLRRRSLRPREAAIVVLGGLVTGLLAGAAGQSIFYVLSGVPPIVAVGRVVAWTLLGCGVGLGMGFIVPNLCRKRAAVAGAAGGIVAAVCFLTLVPVVGDTIGRLLAAGILGLAVGMTTVLVEAVYRKAWLVVHWSEKERSNLALGASPILVGSSSDAHILLPEPECPVPVVAKFTLTDGVIRLADEQTGRSRVLHDGDTLTYGRVLVEVRAAAGVEITETGSRHEDVAGVAASRREEPAVPASVQRARAREAKWYDVEVPSSPPRTTTTRER
ncbi:MAG: VWA domain-containing protein [Planctomycetota bacterium]|jgi:Ca-activated chloride channel family protein